MSARDYVTSAYHDASVAVRQLRRAPAFTAACVLTLALGIGATTALFTVVHGVLLRPLPYPGANRIVQLWQLDRTGHRTQFSDPNFDDVRAGTPDFTALAEYAGGGPVSVTGAVAPTRAGEALVSHGFFDVLGVHPSLGRTFALDEERLGGVPAVVIGHGFWLRAFGGHADAVGKSLVIGNQAYTVVGIMPPMVDVPTGADIWIPRELSDRLPSRTAHNWLLIGRLRPGVTLEQARRDASALATALAGRYGSETLMADVALIPLREELVGSSRTLLLVLFGASGVLMLIACANVTNLLVARLTLRRGELALRLALGAPRSRLLRQCLAESAILAAAAGALGVCLAALATDSLLAFQPGWLPRADAVHLDASVLVFATGLSLATAVGLAVISTWRATRGDPGGPLAAASRRTAGAALSMRFRDGLVVGQVAMTLVLLVTAALFARTLVSLITVDPGFHTQRSVVLDLAIPAEDSVAERARTAFYHTVLTQLSAAPGVTVGAINVMPLAAVGGSNGTFISMASPDETITADDLPRLLHDHTRTGQAAFRVASAGYFAAMGIPLLEGRTFDDRDAPDGPHVALVSASLARTGWPAGSPIGHWIEFGNMDGDLRPLMIIGVVGDVREHGLDTPPQPTVYANYLQRPVGTSRMNIVLAGPVNPSGMASRARAIVTALRPDLVPRTRSMESLVASSVAGPRFVLLLAGAFGGAAALLAALGIYSVISYLVTQRTRELGIRLALGARGTEIVRTVVGRGALLAAIGIGIGSLLAIATTRLLAGLLYGVSPMDPTAFVGVAAVVAAIALAASWFPARRAARIDPLTAVRAD